MTLADATFNERDELSVLFEKKPPSRMLNHQTTTTENDVSSYESYRSIMKSEASKKVAKQNSQKEMPKAPAIKTNEDSGNRYEHILVAPSSLMAEEVTSQGKKRTLVDDRFSASYLQHSSLPAEDQKHLT